MKKPIRRVVHCRVIIEEFEPNYPEQKVGGIILPGAVARGSAWVDKQGQVITPDKSVVYGKITGCGKLGDRTTCRPYPEDMQGDFPLPVGTYVKVLRAVDWRVSPTEQAYNTWDLIEYVLPSDPAPVWAPRE